MRRHAPLAILAALVIAATTMLGPHIGAQEQHRAVIVVGDENPMCVLFDEDEITGAELLERSGVDHVAESSSIGTALCSIDGKGCKRDDCFCEYPSFWGYWTRDPGDDEWRFSNVGAAERVVRDGSADGWSFGKDGKPAPADVDVDAVCGGDDVAAIPTAASGRVTSERPNYLTFVAFATLLAAAAAAAYVLRRRRS